VPWETGTDADSVHLSLLAVGSTRIRITRIQVLHHWLSSWRYMAFSRRISNISFQTGALGYMVEDVAYCIDPASSWTGVFAFLVDAGLVRWAFAVENTFGSAGEIWITLETWQALASSCSAKL